MPVDVKELTGDAPKAPVSKPTELEKAQLELTLLELEAKKIAIENAKLEKLEKEANIQDLTERLAERQMKREDKSQKSRTNGDTIAVENRIKAQKQRQCNHRKGGDGQNAYVNGQGNSPQYAVMKHKVCNGDFWIRCMRCGKCWKPPVEEDYKDREAFLDAKVEYTTALNFSTLNVASSSYTFGFSDGGKHFREMMRPVVI